VSGGPARRVFRPCFDTVGTLGSVDGDR